MQFWRLGKRRGSYVADSGFHSTERKREARPDKRWKQAFPMGG
jgi:hypothetical protein